MPQAWHAGLAEWGWSAFGTSNPGLTALGVTVTSPKAQARAETRRHRRMLGDWHNVLDIRTSTTITTPHTTDPNFELPSARPVRGHRVHRHEPYRYERPPAPLDHLPDSDLRALCSLQATPRRYQLCLGPALASSRSSLGTIPCPKEYRETSVLERPVLILFHYMDCWIHCCADTNTARPEHDSGIPFFLPSAPARIPETPPLALHGYYACDPAMKAK